MDFDFDKMMVLARENPQEFERQRNDLLDEVIQSRRDIEWAKAFQTRIDLELRRGHTPLGRCVRLYSSMWDSFYKLDENFQSLLSALSPRGGNEILRHEESHPRHSAKVLQFKKN